MFPPNNEIEVSAVPGAYGGFGLTVRYNGEFEWHGGLVYATPELALAKKDEELDSTKRFWQRQIARRENAIVAGGWHYRLGTATRNNSATHRGYGGRLFKFRNLATGGIVTSTDVWSQGSIPDFVRPLLPDTHEVL